MSLNEDMAAFFDQLAPAWDNSPEAYDLRERLTAMMGLAPHSVIADIGCGKGVMLAHLLKTNPAKIIAIDLSGEMLRGARALCDDARVDYIHGDVLSVPLPTVDAAVLFNAYPHFLDKKALANRMAQTVRKGGMLVIAHSRSRAAINGTHRGGGASRLSVPLEAAEVEAGKFSPFFAPGTLVDNDAFYFVSALRIS